MNTVSERTRSHPYHSCRTLLELPCAIKLASSTEADTVERATALARCRKELVAIALRNSRSTRLDAASEDAIQETLLQILMTQARFQGMTAAAGRSWLTTIYRRELSRVLRFHSKEEFNHDLTADTTDDVEPDSTGVRIDASDYAVFVALLKTEIQREHRGRSKKVWWAVQCHLDRVLGATMDDELRRYARGSGAPSCRVKDHGRAARAVHNARHRGRQYGARAVARLQKRAGMLTGRHEAIARCFGLLPTEDG
jgi:DNA-directed RNA polymerase specialized sigma24 family protein